MTYHSPDGHNAGQGAAIDEPMLLDAAWVRAEAALGDYWYVRSLVRFAKGWEAVASDGSNRIRTGHGATPVLALLALAGEP